MAELRKDIVSGDWIIIAPRRGRRPHELRKNKSKREVFDIKNCPFEDPGSSGNYPILIYPDRNDWQVQIIKNKFPVLEEHVLGECATEEKSGPYSLIHASGYHDVVITRDHFKNLSELTKKEAMLLFGIIRDRYLMLSEDNCVGYISIFQNWGSEAGASIYHPHYQIIALPVIPPDVNHSLLGSAENFKENKTCVHCKIIEWEMQKKERVIFENERAIAVAPFFSKEPYETRIFPKKHLSYFENTFSEDFDDVIEALQNVLKKVKEKLNDPDYNFFIHTALLKNKDAFGHYHWHIEILPKMNISAGFELGTGIEINSVDPDEAAMALK